MFEKTDQFGVFDGNRLEQSSGSSNHFPVLKLSPVDGMVLAVGGKVAISKCPAANRCHHLDMGRRARRKITKALEEIGAGHISYRITS